GCVFIGWSNTIGNMPAWGATDSRLGNNPMVVALPFGEEAIVLDMAMSQFSFGTMELASAKGETLPVSGGYDKEGNLTGDPSAIIESRRPLPIGDWKGAGLSLLLDILAAVLSGGLATHQISRLAKEHSLSQVFVCIDLSKLGSHSLLSRAVKDIIADYAASQTGNSHTVRYPGERVLRVRKESLLSGIPVLKTKWEEIQKL
ncbi:MAG TPA: Ldh family oxidoreductase, partial [Flavisolibacter sp.]|nr:Ldh family oxidoreductase [Flavisolibacter sp.]